MLCGWYLILLGYEYVGVGCGFGVSWGGFLGNLWLLVSGYGWVCDFGSVVTWWFVWLCFRLVDLLVSVF